ncbi:virulence factor MviN, partial [Actinoplanes sp. NPDC051633]
AQGEDLLVVAQGVANAVGMSAIGLLLVAAVRRRAGAQALAGLGRAAAAGIVAAITAAFAGWATVANLGLWAGLLVGGPVVLATYAVVAFVLDAPDARRLGALLIRRGRREKT